MLVLTRKPGQKIIIGDDVTIEIISIDQHQVKIGIRAPRDVSVHRSEIYEAIRDESGKPKETPQIQDGTVADPKPSQIQSDTPKSGGPKKTLGRLTPKQF